MIWMMVVNIGDIQSSNMTVSSRMLISIITIPCYIIVNSTRRRIILYIIDRTISLNLISNVFITRTCIFTKRNFGIITT